jgi:hypothetical protein
MMMVEKEEEDFNASLGRLIQFTSIGVDTRDLLPQDEGHITREKLFMVRRNSGKLEHYMGKFILISYLYFY